MVNLEEYTIDYNTDRLKTLGKLDFYKKIFEFYDNKQKEIESNNMPSKEALICVKYYYEFINNKKFEEDADDVDYINVCLLYRYYYSLLKQRNKLEKI